MLKLTFDSLSIPSKTYFCFCFIGSWFSSRAKLSLVILMDRTQSNLLIFGCFNLNLSSDSLFRVLSGLICLLECDLLSPQARFAALTVLLESKKRPESSVNFVTQKLLQDLAQNSNELVSNSRFLIFKDRVLSSNHTRDHKMFLIF